MEDKGKEIVELLKKGLVEHNERQVRNVELANSLQADLVGGAAIIGYINQILIAIENDTTDTAAPPELKLAKE